MFKQQLLWFAIAASLLFNVFFAAGYLQAKSNAGAADDQTREAAVLSELNLDAAQAERFKTLRNDFREMSKVYQDGITLVENELLSEFASGAPDPQIVEGLMQRDADLHRERRMVSLERLREFAMTLSPDQSREFIERMSERNDRHRRRQEMFLRRFDTNGDGKMSEAEHEVARTTFEAERQRRRQMMDGRGWDGDRGRRDRHRGDGRDGRERDGRGRSGPEMMLLRRYFDTNNDGRLDPEELAALHEQFDTDNDGWLDEAERDAVGQWIQQKQREGDVQPPEGGSPA